METLAFSDSGGDLSHRPGVGKCPMTWVYWTSPKIVAIIDQIPNGWVWLGDVQWGHLMTHVGGVINWVMVS